jgi:hypothetical protein
MIGHRTGKKNAPAGNVATKKRKKRAQREKPRCAVKPSIGNQILKTLPVSAQAENFSFFRTLKRAQVQKNKLGER